MNTDAIRFAVFVAGLVAACGASAPIACTCAAGQVCLGEAGCADVCSADRPCKPGHACRSSRDVSGAPVLACDPSCDQSLCPARAECITAAGACTAVECGFNVSCTSPTDLCDAIANRCYAANGACVTAADCPRFGKDGGVLCADGFCRVIQPPSVRVVGLTDTDLVVSSPHAGASFADEQALEFAWSAGGTGALLLVLSGKPAGVSDILARAIWGGAVQKDAPERLTWAQGAAIANSTWQAATAPAPAGQTLYLLVQALDADRLLAASALVPFRVRGGWPRPGDACDNSRVDSCDAPAAVQWCFQATCRVVCASNPDCTAADPSSRTVCGAPQRVDAARELRFCE